MFSPGSIWKKNMRVINLDPQAEQNFGSGLITLNYIESANVDIQYLDRMITPLWCLTTIWGQTWTNGFQWFVSSSLNLLNACRPQGAMSLFRRVSDMLWSQWKAARPSCFVQINRTWSREEKSAIVAWAGSTMESMKRSSTITKPGSFGRPDFPLWVSVQIESVVGLIVVCFLVLHMYCHNLYSIFIVISDVVFAFRWRRVTAHLLYNQRSPRCTWCVHSTWHQSPGTNCREGQFRAMLDAYHRVPHYRGRHAGPKVPYVCGYSCHFCNGCLVETWEWANFWTWAWSFGLLWRCFCLGVFLDDFIEPYPLCKLSRKILIGYAE